MAGREDLRLAETDRAAASGEAARTGQGGLDLRLQLRGAQPAPTASADRKPNPARPTAELRLKQSVSL